MKYKIRSFILGVKEARRILLPPFMVGPLTELMMRGENSHLYGLLNQIHNKSYQTERIE